MTGSELIRQAAKEAGVKIKDLAVALNMPEQTFHNRLYRDTMPFNFVAEVIEKLGLKITLTRKDQ